MIPTLKIISLWIFKLKDKDIIKKKKKQKSIDRITVSEKLNVSYWLSHHDFPNQELVKTNW